MTTNHIDLRMLIYCVGISGIILLGSGSQYLFPTFAQNQNDPLFSVDSSPYDKPYKYWTQKWWEWNLSFNKTNHPNNNYTDEKCAFGQKADSPVWFLVQPYPYPDPEGTNFKRTCNIPYGKAIITATQSGDCNYGVKGANTDEGLIKCAKKGNDFTRVSNVTIDNKTFKDYQDGRRVLSDYFNESIIPENIMGYQNFGKSKAVVDGYYIFLKPLTPGKHVLHYYYETKPPKAEDIGYKTHQEGTWNLIIKKPQDIIVK